MNKTLLVFSLALLALLASVSALTPEQEAEAAFYAKSHGWSIPTYQSGWDALYAKSQSGVCTWTRVRDGREFVGVWARLSTMERVCVSTSSHRSVRSVAPVSVLPVESPTDDEPIVEPPVEEPPIEPPVEPPIIPPVEEPIIVE